MGNKTSDTTSTTSIPAATSARYDSAYGVAENVAKTPFQTYSNDPNAFVAPLNATQQAGIQNTNAYAGAAQPYYTAATNTLGQGLAAATPYYDAAGNYYSNAANTGAQYAGASTNALQGAQQVGTDLANTSYNTLQGANAKAAPYFQSATGYGLAGGQGVDPSQLNAAAIMQYLSPFLNSVYGATLAGQAQQNAQQLSGLKGGAIKAGAFGGDRAGIAAGNLAYQQNLANSQINANLLNTGYMNALNTAGEQQALGLAAAQANRAATQQTSDRMLNIGGQQFNEGATTAAQLAALGNQQFGQGATTAQQFANLGNQQFGQGQASGTAAKGLGEGVYGMGASAAQQLAALGSGAQTAGLQGAQAQGAAGATAQQTDTAGLAALYNQFLQKQSYPFQVARFGLDAALGLGSVSGGTTTTTMPRGILAARGGAINDRVERYAGGLVNASMGGHVYPEHAGEHYADGGGAYNTPDRMYQNWFGGGGGSFFNTPPGNYAAQSGGFPQGQRFGPTPFESPQATFAFPSATGANSGADGFRGFSGGLLPSYTSVAPSSKELEESFKTRNISSLLEPYNDKMADWQKLIGVTPKPPVDYGAGDGAYRTRSDVGPEGGAPGETSPYGQVGVNTTGSPWGDAKGMVNAISDAISGTSQQSGPLGSGGSYEGGTSSGYDQSRGGRVHKTGGGGLAPDSISDVMRRNSPTRSGMSRNYRGLPGETESSREFPDSLPRFKPNFPAALTARAPTGVLGEVGSLAQQYNTVDDAFTRASGALRGTAADGNKKATSGLFGYGGEFNRDGVFQRQRSADGGLIGRHHYATNGRVSDVSDYNNEDSDINNIVPRSRDIPTIKVLAGNSSPYVVSSGGGSGGGSGGTNIGGQIGGLFGQTGGVIGSIVGKIFGFADGGGVAPHHYAEGGLAGRRGYEGGGYPGAGQVYPDDFEAARPFDEALFGSGRLPGSQNAPVAPAATTEYLLGADAAHKNRLASGPPIASALTDTSAEPGPDVLMDGRRIKLQPDSRPSLTPGRSALTFADWVRNPTGSTLTAADWVRNPTGSALAVADWVRNPTGSLGDFLSGRPRDTFSSNILSPAAQNGANMAYNANAPQTYLPPPPNAFDNQGLEIKPENKKPFSGEVVAPIGLSGASTVTPNNVGNNAQEFASTGLGGASLDPNVDYGVGTGPREYVDRNVANGAVTPAGGVAGAGVGLVSPSSAAPAASANAPAAAVTPAPRPVGGLLAPATDNQTRQAEKEQPQNWFDTVTDTLGKYRTPLVSLAMGLQGMRGAVGIPGALIGGFSGAAKGYEMEKAAQSQQAFQKAQTENLPARIAVDTRTQDQALLQSLIERRKLFTLNSVPPELNEQINRLITKLTDQAIPGTQPFAMPGSSGVAAPNAVAGASGDPLTVRLNNPGAIKGTPWTQGQPGYVGTENGFAKFDTPENGRLAMDTLLSNYGERGLDTPESIIRLWASEKKPGEAGYEDDKAKVDNYVRRVSQALNVAPGSKIDMKNPAVLRAITDTITSVESGRPVAPTGATTQPVAEIAQPAPRTATAASTDADHTATVGALTPSDSNAASSLSNVLTPEATRVARIAQRAGFSQASDPFLLTEKGNAAAASGDNPVALELWSRARAELSRLAERGTYTGADGRVQIVPGWASATAQQILNSAEATATAKRFVETIPGQDLQIKTDIQILNETAKLFEAYDTGGGPTFQNIKTTAGNIANIFNAKVPDYIANARSTNELIEKLSNSLSTETAGANLSDYSRAQLKTTRPSGSSDPVTNQSVIAQTLALKVYKSVYNKESVDAFALAQKTGQEFSPVKFLTEFDARHPNFLQVLTDDFKKTTPVKGIQIDRNAADGTQFIADASTVTLNDGTKSTAPHVVQVRGGQVYFVRNVK